MPLPSSPTTPVTPSTAPPPCRSPPQLDLLVQGSVGATAPSPTGGPAFRQRHCSVVLRWLYPIKVTGVAPFRLTL
ncbi:hypothetical protein OsI_06803 [Oryza sativa Indica Group]|uniref:Uncharacterized protein n=2 Tax=Oryza sativa TaxID=4530 RepID=B9F531_ORYSJ|nr:hypothetical protein OsI_06803 [Oryza sativa Indica Group]EEE56762.1 hypothetical protein OsJ_06308 [Oryza sativa Japonica Group]